MVRGAEPGPDRRRHHRPRRRAVGRGHRLRRRRRWASAPRSWPASTRPWSTSVLQQRGAWQVDRRRPAARPTRRRSPTPPATPPYLDADQKLSCWRPPTSSERLEQADRLGARAPRRARRRRDDPQGRPGGHGQAAARVPAAPAAGRRPQGAGASSTARPTATRPTTTAARVEAADLPEHVREAALREVDKLERTSEQSPEAAGSAPGWTPCSSCRGTSAPRTPTTSPAPGRSSTPTTPAWTT